MKQLFAFITSALTVWGNVYIYLEISTVIAVIIAGILITAVLYRVSLLTLSHKNDGSHRH